MGQGQDNKPVKSARSCVDMDQLNSLETKRKTVNWSQRQGVEMEAEIRRKKSKIYLPDISVSNTMY